MIYPLIILTFPVISLAAYALLLIGAIVSYRKSGKKKTILLAVASLVLIGLIVFSNIYHNMYDIEEMNLRLLGDVQMFGGMISTILLGAYGIALFKETAANQSEQDNPITRP